MSACACAQLTRNESALTVRQCTAVNPHVLALVAASLRLDRNHSPRKKARARPDRRAASAAASGARRGEKAAAGFWGEGDYVEGDTTSSSDDDVDGGDDWDAEELAEGDGW